jgi:hypothetical protein
VGFIPSVPKLAQKIESVDKEVDKAGYSIPRNAANRKNAYCISPIKAASIFENLSIDQQLAKIGAASLVSRTFAET